MKKNYLSLLCAGVMCVVQACSDNHPYQVSGKLTGVKSDSLVIRVVNNYYGYIEPIDTVVMKNGSFGFDVPASIATMIMIAPLSSDKADGKKVPSGIFLLAVPGEQAVVSGTVENYIITGSDFYKPYNEILAITNPVMKQMDAITEKYRPLFATTGTGCDSISSACQLEIRQVQDKASDIALQYIKDYPDQELSALLIAGIKPEDRQKAVGMLSQSVRDGRMAAFYQAFVETDESERYFTRAAKNIQPGLTAPDFTLKNLNGKDFVLSSLRGKYIVLDFWGSWCGACIKEIPDLKKTYEQYNDKVEFVSIDCNDTRQTWEKAVAQYKLPWTQVHNNGIPADVAALYAVTLYPSKCIIDPNGKIVKMFTGETSEFYTSLDELLK